MGRGTHIFIPSPFLRIWHEELTSSCQGSNRSDLAQSEARCHPHLVALAAELCGGVSSPNTVRVGLLRGCGRQAGDSPRNARSSGGPGMGQVRSRVSGGQGVPWEGLPAYSILSPASEPETPAPPARGAQPSLSTL